MPALGDVGVKQYGQPKKPKKAELPTAPVAVFDPVPAIQERARLVHAALVQKYPGAAAAAVMSSTPTIDLQAHTSILKQGLVWADWVTASDGIPGALLPYYHQAFMLGDPQQRALYLGAIDRARQMSPEDQAIALVSLAQIRKSINEGGKLEEPKSPLQQITGGVGTLASAPFALPIAIASRATDIVGAGVSHIPGVGPGVAGAIDVAQHAVGYGLTQAGTGATFAIRNTLEAGVAAMVMGTKDIATGSDSHWSDIFQSWGDIKAGGHSPISRTVADVAGVDVNDPNWQGLFDFTDLGGDLTAAIILGKVGGERVDYLRKTQAGGGVQMGAEWVKSRLGEHTTDAIAATLEKVPGGEAATSYLIDRFPNMKPQLAKELSRATDVTEVRRVAAEYIDRVPERELPKVQDDLNAVRKQITEKRPIAIDLTGDQARALLEKPTAEYPTVKGHVATPGNPVLEYDPVSGKGLISEGRHRTEALGAAEPAQYEVRYVDTATIERQGSLSPGRPAKVLDPALREQLASPADAVEIQALESRAAALEQTRTDLQAHEIQWEFPRRSRISTWMRQANLGGDNMFGRALRRQFGEGGRTDVSKWSDDMAPQELYIYDRTGGGIPPDAVSGTVESLRKTMNIAKVPKELQRAIIEDYLSYGGKDGFYHFQLSFNNALEEGLTRGGKRALTPEAQQLLRFSENTYVDSLKSPLEITHPLADGSTITTTENVLQRADGHPLPSRPSQFLGNKVKLPNPEYLRQASSFTRHYTRGLPSFVRMPLDVARFTTLELPRLVIRPSLLVSRLVPMGLKIQFDEIWGRMTLSGLNPLKAWTKGKYDYGVSGIPLKASLRELLPEGENMSILGMVDHELMRQGEVVTSRMSTRGFADLPANQRYLVGNGLAERIVDMHLDELTKKVVAYGPEGTLRYLEDHPDTHLGRIYTNDIKPLLEETGTSPQEWLQRTDAEITQAVGGSTELRSAIATGKWDVGRDVPTGESIELQFQKSELEMARSAALDATDPHMTQVLNLRAEELQRRVDRLETRIQSTNEVSLKNRDALVNEVLNAVTEGRFQLPREVTVHQRALPPDVPRTMLERVRANAEKVNQFIYKGLKPLSNVELKGARGSTYRQVLEETHANLVRQGYSPAEALRIGQYHAAFFTRDLHYDISARSTMDRQMKDTFWFAPVVRENLLTYFVKLPREHFWPVGIVAEVGGAHALVQGLKDFGLLKYDTFYNSETGKNEKVLKFYMPWVSDLVAKLVDDPTAGGISIGGINPATAGQGLLPTLSPGAEAILDMTAKSMPKSVQPLFEFLGHTLEFDQDVHSVGYAASIPSPVRHALTIAGINLPYDSLSGGAIADANRKAKVQSLRWAASELAKDGILPPGGDATDAEIAAYRVKLEEQAGHYRTTLTVIHLVGSAILPGQFDTGSGGVNRAGQAYYNWRGKNAAYLAAQGDWEANKAAWYAEQNAYLKAHPAAWPFSIGTHDAPPGYEYDPETFKDLPTLEPTAWTEKALAQAHYWQDDMPTSTDATGATKTTDLTNYAVLNAATKEKTAAEAPNTVGYHGQPPPTPPQMPAELTPETIATLSPRLRLRITATLSDTDITTLNKGGLALLGVPDFEGRSDLLKTIKTINNQYSKLSDADKALYADRATNLLTKAAQKYGQKGMRVLTLTRWDTTPAEKLQFAGHLRGPVAGQAVAEAQNIWRDTIAQGYNPLYDSNYVVARKAEFFAQIDKVRRENPGFDQEMRRIILGITDVHGPMMNVDAYNQLFFGMGYGDTAITEALKNG